MFLCWASREGYAIDVRILDLPSPRVPEKEPTTYTDVVVRLLVGSGIRRAEACGLALSAPDRLSDLMVDSMRRGRVELRVHGDGGPRAGNRAASRLRRSWRRPPAGHRFVQADSCACW